MRLEELLVHKKDAILERCVSSTLETYPPETIRFLHNEKDPFANPVGSTLRRELGAILEGLIGSIDLDNLTPSLDAIIRIRAVQGFSPSEALAFAPSLKKAIREELQKEKPDAELLNDLAQLESCVDELMLAAFDLYVACREKIAEIRVHEAQSERDRLVRLMQAMGSKAVKGQE